MQPRYNCQSLMSAPNRGGRCQEDSERVACVYVCKPLDLDDHNMTIGSRRGCVRTQRFYYRTNDHWTDRDRPVCGDKSVPDRGVLGKASYQASCMARGDRLRRLNGGGVRDDEVSLYVTIQYSIFGVRTAFDCC